MNSKSIILALALGFVITGCKDSQTPESKVSEETIAKALDGKVDLEKEKKEEDRNRIILNVAKQRNGPVGEVELVWLPQFTKFEDAEQPGDRI